ncbi:MAG: HEAT repeat domain-containing protein [Planctomycetes bacterium]|nr:HEAT repeat domain-containing protein [Planctomycetota bacterium]
MKPYFIFSVIVLGIITDASSLATASSPAEGKSCLVGPDRAKLLQDKGYPTRTSKQIIKATKSESYFVRFIALELLTQRIADKAIPTLRKALSDPKGRVRWTAAHLLGTLGDKSGLKQMRQDLKELAPNDGAPFSPDPNLSAEENNELEMKRNYQLEDALEVAKVLAELGDFSGYNLAAKMAIEGPLSGQRWRAISVLVKMAKTDGAELQAKGLYPVFLLKTSAQSEQHEGVFNILTNLVQKELDDDTAIEILEIAKNSPNQSEKARRIAQMQLDTVKARNKLGESRK